MESGERWRMAVLDLAVSADWWRHPHHRTGRISPDMDQCRVAMTNGDTDSVDGSGGGDTPPVQTSPRGCGSPCSPYGSPSSRHRPGPLLQDHDSFVHINSWYEHFEGSSPCSRTETIYLPRSRSEEPVASNMDISTGHIVLVRIHSQRCNNAVPMPQALAPHWYNFGLPFCFCISGVYVQYGT